MNTTHPARHLGPQFPPAFDRPFLRYFNDENGAGGNTPPPGTGEQQQQSSEQQQSSTPPWGDDPTKFDPAKAWKLIENLRTDVVTQKTKTEQAIADATAKAQKDTLAEFARLLTGEAAPETDPAKLNETLTKLRGTVSEKDTALTTAKQEVKAGQVALQVAIHAPALGGNTALLLNNEQFKNSIASVEPTDEAAVKAAITKALQENAALKQPPRRSGTEQHTGPTLQSLEAQLAAATEKKDWAETIRLKQQIAAARQGQA